EVEHRTARRGQRDARRANCTPSPRSRGRRPAAARPPGGARRTRQALRARSARGARCRARRGRCRRPREPSSCHRGRRRRGLGVTGGREVVVDGQIALARAAAANGVRRILPSDFAI
ncbi:hypothetical protein AVDCRST_MAG82-1967, partial [uncultured Rubrobacteraceae bacterium]